MAKKKEKKGVIRTRHPNGTIECVLVRYEIGRVVVLQRDVVNPKEIMFLKRGD